MEQCSGAELAQACRGRCEVAVQWEEPKDRFRDVAVQVDLIGLSSRTPGSSDLPWRCLTVRPGQAEGGALWHCCIHGVAPPPPSAILLGSSPSRTPELQTAPPTMHLTPSRPPPSPALQSSPALLPSMPSCGDSPTSHHQGAPDTCVLAASAEQGPKDAEVQAPMGLMAPLSSDEDTQLPGPDGHSSSTDTPTRKRRRRPKLPLSDTEISAIQERRRKTERAARLPLRYLLDYDLESHNLLSANKTAPENGEGAGPGVKQEGEAECNKNAPLMPAEFQTAARETSEDDWTKNAPDQDVPRPLSPREVLDTAQKSPVLHLKLKNVQKSCPSSSKKTPGWSVNNAAVKEELAGDENAALEPSDCPKANIKRIKEASEVEIKQEDKDADRKDGILAINLTQPLDGGEKNEPRTEFKRKPGRPKKSVNATVKIKEEKVQVKVENGLPEALERPRRAMVGPPMRYLLESEGRGTGKRAPIVSDDESEAPRPKLKLGDVVNGDAATGMVKKVQILKGDTERRAWLNHLESVTQIKYEAVEDIYVLPENAVGGASTGEQQRKRARRKKVRKGSKMDLSLKVLDAFLVFRDEDSSAVTLIPPCAVKLLKLPTKEPVVPR